MATYTVTNTQDTDSQLQPAPADVPGSFKAALRAASGDAGSTIAFALPANSTISLLSFTYPSSVATQAGTINLDFTGAPGLTFGSSASASIPGAFTVLRDYVDMTVTGALKGDSTAGYLLSLFAPTATATLNTGASISGASTVTALNDGGARLTIGANGTVSSTAGNALVVTQAYGAVTNQTVTIASGATVSSSAGSRSAVFADSSATGATITNSGTISATGNAGYVGNSNAALVNTASGVVTSTATSALQLNQASTLSNAGSLTGTAVAATVYNTGTGAVTNSGQISATQGAGYNAMLASTLTNASGGRITSSATGQSAVVLTGGAALNNAGTVTQTATTAATAANANGVYANGTGAITNSGTISSTGNAMTNTAASLGAAVANLNASTFTNSGTISSTGDNAYAAYVVDSTIGNHTALINTASGLITNSYATSTVNLNVGVAATLINAGLISNTAGGTTLLNSGTGAITNSGTIQSAAAVGASTATAYLGQGASTATNTATGLITTSGTTAVNLSASGATLVNAGVVSNTYSGTNTAQAVRIAAGATLTNSGTVRESNPTGYAVQLLGGGTVTSTGTIQSGGTYAIAGQGGGTATATVNLLAGSQTVGAIGGTTASPLAITVAGSLTGAIIGAAANADALTLVNGLTLSGVINLGGGGDTLTLTGASGSNTLVGANVLSAVALTKAGAGAWTLSGAGANYSSVALNGGVLELAAANSAGAGAITFGANSQTLRLDLAAGANYTLANTLTGFGVEDLVDIRNTTVTATAVSGDTLTLTTAGGSTATLSFAAGTLSGKTVSAAIDGAGGSYVSVGAAVAPAVVAPGQTTNLDSSNSPVVNGDVTDNGVAQVGGPTPITYTGSISGAGSVVVSGGVVNFTGASTYTGATTITSGTLVVNGSIANSPVSVGSGGVLGGSGTTGAVTAASGATVSPGNSPGVLSTGDLALVSGAALKVEIAGLVNDQSATLFDQIKVTGAVNLGGATLNTALYGGFAPPATGSAPIVIIDNDGIDAVVGTFQGLAEGAVFQVGGQEVKVSYAGGTGNDVTLQFVGPYVAPPAPPITAAPPQTASQSAGYAVMTNNLVRASATDAALSNPSSPLYAQAQAEVRIASKLNAGQISAADAQAQLFHLVDGTVSVAEISYAFFTGRSPTAAGLNYLVNSPANPTDLNDAYYQQFTVENRYINFASNLATGQGAGAAAFQAAYGGLSLQDAAAKAYQAVFGITPTADKVAAILDEQVNNGLGGTETRAQYLADVTGGSALAQKAAVIGFLLADSVKEGFGTYQQANLHFLQDLAHGTAAFNVDLLAAYGQAPSLVGQPLIDATLGT